MNGEPISSLAKSRRPWRWRLPPCPKICGKNARLHCDEMDMAFRQSRSFL